MATKKTLYHSELVQLSADGPVTIDILSEPIESKYKRGTFIVLFNIDGNERTYQVENEQCLEAFENLKNHRVELEASGSRDDAELNINVLEQLSGKPSGSAQRKESRPAARPPQAQQKPAHPQPPARQQEAVRPSLNAELFRLANAEIKIQCLVAAVAGELKDKRGIELTPEQMAGMAGRLFIGVTRDHLHANLPSDHLIDCSPKQAADPENDGR